MDGLRMRPVFGTAVARSGGGVFSHLVSAHPQAVLARHPFLELFRSYRNALVREWDDRDIARATPADAPFGDHYFRACTPRVLDLLGQATLDVRVHEADLANVRERGAARAALESPDLADHFDRLDGGTYRQVLDSALEMVREVRQASEAKWIGFQEPWVIDFLPALARAYPDAAFVVLVRDARGVVASMRGIVSSHPEQVGQLLSYVRHWRKYVALASAYLRDPLFDQRLMLVRYEDLVADPDPTLAAVWRFLDIESSPLPSTQIVDAATGQPWTANSSFNDVRGGLDPIAAERWRTVMAADDREAVEWLCGPELALCGYAVDQGGESRTASVLQRLLRDQRDYCSWRSDLGDDVFDLGGELLRRSMLGPDVGETSPDLIRRLFLSLDVHARLKTAPLAPLFPTVAT